MRYDLPARRFALLRHEERYRSKVSLAFTAMLQEEVRAGHARRDAVSDDI